VRKHHLDRGAAHAASHRLRQAGIDGLAHQIMTEPETVPLLGQQPGGHRLSDLAPHIKRRPTEQPGQLIQGEAVPEHRGHLHGVPGRRGQPLELAGHRADQPARQTRARSQSSRPAIDGHEVLRAQPAQQFGQQERLAFGPAERLPQRLIGLSSDSCSSRSSQNRWSADWLSSRRRAGSTDGSSVDTRASRIAPSGTARAAGSPPPRNTRIPPAAARLAASASSVVFPMPAGPVTSTTLPRPAPRAFNCPRNSSTCGCLLRNLGATGPS
jgi:hypothetical protein